MVWLVAEIECAVQELSPLPLLDEAHVLAVCAREGIKPHNAYKMWRGLIKEGHTSVRALS